MVCALYVVRGPRGYDVLYTVGDVVYKKFKEACYARGLLDDDKEWHEAIEKPSLWATGRQLRRLFVLILDYLESQRVYRTVGRKTLLLTGLK